jgi:hypothetical protein
MHMGMQGELLTPGVQHAEETDFCTEMFGIARDLEKSFRTGSETDRYTVVSFRS